MDSKRSVIENACSRILEDFEGVLKWKWDERFEALLAEFSIQTQEKVSAILQKHLKHAWDVKTLKKAPKDIRNTSEHFGSLRKGQLLFTTDPGGSDHIIAVFWPWGDGESVSLRMAMPD